MDERGVNVEKELQRLHGCRITNRAEACGVFSQCGVGPNKGVVNLKGLFKTA